MYCNKDSVNKQLYLSQNVYSVPQFVLYNHCKKAYFNNMVNYFAGAVASVKTNIIHSQFVLDCSTTL